MRLYRIAFLLTPLVAFGANKEMAELQRDMATLQEQLRSLTTNTTASLAALTALVKENLDAANKNRNDLAALEARISERLDKQVATVGQPVAVLGSKVDQMSNDFQSLRESISDLRSSVGKLEQRLVDINNAVRTIQAPPPPPSASGATPAIPAATLFEMALGDKLGGRSDMALQEFGAYVQQYGDTDKAPEAQFNIGQIHWEQNTPESLENAVKDFDAVLERYSSSNKTADAMYMKGQALVKLGRKTDGAKEFRSLVAKYPTNELARRACTQLTTLGYTCTLPAAAARKKKG
jgi:TolA-binding protein